MNCEGLKQNVVNPSAICSGIEGVSVCGFYTFGEFARTTGSSGVHNSSVAILAL